MGYTHYWYRKDELDEDLFAKITADFRQIILPLDDAGVRLAGPRGIGLPEIGSSKISFNGLRDCGHARNPSVYIPFPTELASGVGGSHDAIAEANLLFVKLTQRTCDGTCNYETFQFERSMRNSHFLRQEDGRYLCFCKTKFKPYDLAVQCALLIAKHHLANNIEVASQGSDFLWNDPRALCHAYLGYPLNEFYIDEKQGLIQHQKEFDEVQNA